MVEFRGKKEEDRGEVEALKGRKSACIYSIAPSRPCMLVLTCRTLCTLENPL